MLPQTLSCRGSGLRPTADLFFCGRLVQRGTFLPLENRGSLPSPMAVTVSSANVCDAVTLPRIHFPSATNGDRTRPASESRREPDGHGADAAVVPRIVRRKNESAEFSTDLSAVTALRARSHLQKRTGVDRLCRDFCVCDVRHVLRRRNAGSRRRYPLLRRKERRGPLVSAIRF